MHGSAGKEKTAFPGVFFTVNSLVVFTVLACIVVTIRSNDLEVLSQVAIGVGG